MKYPRLGVGAVTLTLIILLHGPVAGVARADQTRQPTFEPAEAMVVDAVVLRPLGLAATVLGAGVFVISLPFTLPSGSVGDAAEELVAKPARYTFQRPLGQIENP